MLSDAELERFARHLALPEVGLPGQEQLSATYVTCLHQEPWAMVFREALRRCGVHVNTDPVIDSVRIAVVHDALLPLNTASFADATVSIGTVDLTAIDLNRQASLDATAALGVKTVWLGAALGSELLLWRLGQRRARYSVTLDFPELRAVGIDA